MSERTRWNKSTELMSNYICLLLRCVRLALGNGPEGLKKRGDLRKYNRSLPVHVKTKWELKFFSVIP